MFHPQIIRISLKKSGWKYERFVKSERLVKCEISLTSAQNPLNCLENIRGLFIILGPIYNTFKTGSASWRIWAARVTKYRRNSCDSSAHRLTSAQQQFPNVRVRAYSCTPKCQLVSATGDGVGAEKRWQARPRLHARGAFNRRPLLLVTAADITTRSGCTRARALERAALGVKVKTRWPQEEREGEGT